jgi:hypothetical protein
MPVAGLGWSAGDIVKGIELLTIVYKGLQEAGGAASEFQKTSAFLKGFIITLEHIEKLSLECTDPTLVQAINTLGKTALDPVFDFVNETAKYEPSLGRNPSKHSVIATYRKAEYALREPRRVAKLQADLEMALGPIHLLLSSESL